MILYCLLVRSPQWFVQNVDHYDMQNLNTFRQQYFVNDTFWGGPGSPIFLVLGGEGPLSAAYVGSHFWTGSLAQQYSERPLGGSYRDA